MITKYKLFETINEGKPEIGDYVICEEDPRDTDFDMKLNFIIKTSIGKLVYIDKYHELGYEVTYDKSDTPAELYDKLYHSISSHQIRPFRRNEVKFWSKSKEELEPIIQAIKYNL